MTIALTMGDPAGIGPEIALKVLNQSKLRDDILLIGDLTHLKDLQKRLFRKNLPDIAILDLMALGGKKVRLGRPSPLAGHASGAYISKAVELAQHGLVDSIVTAPINKVSFQMGGWGKKFVGHTEMLAALTKTKIVRSMLMHETLRAVHVTSHIPFRDVPNALSIQNIKDTIHLAHEGLMKLGIARPRIGVAGLNPHAGDNGVLGKEEMRIILPAIKKAQRLKILVSGPFAADALWPQVKAQKFDVGIAMYHDQGQIAVKLEGFKMGANNNHEIHGIQMTLGLPFVRLSVDHGTAYDIAGKGIASEQSLIDAIALARKISAQ